MRAKTVNGSVTAKMGRTEWKGDLELQTVNGSVVVELPASASTEVKGATVNGSIESDFGLEVTGQVGPQEGVRAPSARAGGSCTSSRSTAASRSAGGPDR